MLVPIHADNYTEESTNGWHIIPFKKLEFLFYLCG